MLKNKIKKLFVLFFEHYEDPKHNLIVSLFAIGIAVFVIATWLYSSLSLVSIYNTGWDTPFSASSWNAVTFATEIYLLAYVSAIPFITAVAFATICYGWSLSGRIKLLEKRIKDLEKTKEII